MTGTHSISKLKKRFKKLYIRYHAELDEFSCGADLAEHIRPSLYMMKLKLKEIYDELRAIDQGCPRIPWLE